MEDDLSAEATALSLTHPPGGKGASRSQPVADLSLSSFALPSLTLSLHLARKPVASLCPLLLLSHPPYSRLLSLSPPL